jgi:hypothetical protein
MSALLKEDNLRAGDGVRQPPGRERGDVHVIASVDHQRRKFEAGEIGSEIQIGGGLGNGFGDGRLISEVAHVAHVGVAFLRGVKDHAEMVAQVGPRCGFGFRAKLLRFLFVLFLNIGKDIRQQMDDALP